MSFAESFSLIETILQIVLLALSIRLILKDW